MRDPCTRWMELSDRQLVGDEVSEFEVELMRSHELECAQCGREAALFRELRSTPLHLVPSEEDVQRILLQAELNQGDEPWTAEKPKRRIRVSSSGLALVAAVVTLAACFWLYVRVPSAHRLSATEPTAALNSGSAARVATPAIGPSALKASPRAPASEDSCNSLVDGIVLCLVAGSELGEIHLDGPRRTVELKRGRAVASLEPQPVGTSFSITTAAGKVTAVGTIFSVEVGHEGDVYASVTRGKVLVEGIGTVAAFSLTAGQTVRLGDTEISALPALEAQQDLDLVARWAATNTDTRASTRAEQAEPQLPDAKSVGSVVPPARVGDELGYARALRAQGQFARAAALYRSIYARSPRSQGGRVALMSLASLQLSSLGDATGALASYESYLAGGGGPLSEQAEYGRIRALHQLGRAAQEREATRRFIARYPNAPETKLLKKRDSVPNSP